MLLLRCGAGSPCQDRRSLACACHPPRPRRLRLPSHHPSVHPRQAHATFQDLILDLQEAVLAEGARLLEELAVLGLAKLDPLDAPPPPFGDAAALLPAELQAAGAILRACTVGVLPSGQTLNADGLQRNALPHHLPPALTSSPFSWVTLDLWRMLRMEPSSAAAWACAYLSLAPKYSPTTTATLWAWLRQRGMLMQLVACAAHAVAHT